MRSLSRTFPPCRWPGSVRPAMTGHLLHPHVASVLGRRLGSPFAVTAHSDIRVARERATDTTANHPTGGRAHDPASSRNALHHTLQDSLSIALERPNSSFAAGWFTLPARAAGTAEVEPHVRSGYNDHEEVAGRGSERPLRSRER